MTLAPLSPGYTEPCVVLGCQDYTIRVVDRSVPIHQVSDCCLLRQAVAVYSVLHKLPGKEKSHDKLDLQSAFSTSRLLVTVCILLVHSEVCHNEYVPMVVLQPNALAFFLFWLSLRSSRRDWKRSMDHYLIPTPATSKSHQNLSRATFIAHLQLLAWLCTSSLICMACSWSPA